MGSVKGLGLLTKWEQVIVQRILGVIMMLTITLSLKWYFLGYILGFSVYDGRYSDGTCGFLKECGGV